MSDRQLTESQANILRLADHIDRLPERLLDMRTIGNPECGAPGCFIGHLAWMLGKYGTDEHRQFLGLDEHKFNRLCVGREASKDQAVRTLRHLALTGEIDWGIPE